MVVSLGEDIREHAYGAEYEDEPRGYGRTAPVVPGRHVEEVLVIREQLNLDSKDAYACT